MSYCGTPGGQHVKEPGIALGNGSMMVVTAVGGGAGQYLAWAWRSTVPGSSWIEGALCGYPGNGDGPFPHLFDPSIVYDAHLDDYLIAAIGKRDFEVDGFTQSEFVPVVARFDPGQQTFAWTAVAPVSLPEGFPICDKPWIVAGSRSEFYFVYRYSLFYDYRRTTNGGHTQADWQGGWISANGALVSGGVALQPSVHHASRLYAAYTKSTTESSSTIRFLAGRDDGLPPDPVNFWELANESGAPLEVLLNHDLKAYAPYIPGHPDPVGKQTVQIAIDPTDYDRLYVAYHDLDCDDGSKMSIWLHRLEYDGAHWTLSDRFRVSRLDPTEDCSDDSTGTSHFDQFLPAITVDTDGVVHIAYYDDTGFDQTDNALLPKFNLVNSKSCDAAGADPLNPPTWEHQVFGTLAEPFLDFALGYDTPREYIGITFREETDGTIQIAIAAPGTDPMDCMPDRSAIYVLRD